MSCLGLAVVLGEKVERASATLPQTATESLFTISGGRVVVTSLLGTVTVTTGSLGTGYVLVNPTVGTSYTLRSDSINGESPGFVTSHVEVGTAWLNGTVGVACRPLIVPEGTIDFQTNGSVVGEMLWTLTYVALDEGATVTAV